MSVVCFLFEQFLFFEEEQIYLIEMAMSAMSIMILQQIEI